MSKFKVVITDYLQENYAYEEEILSPLGVTLVPAKARAEAEIIEACKAADGVLITRTEFNERVINSLNNCKVITRYGVGVNNVDLEAATKKGICVVNVPDYCVEEVSDTTIAFLLALARKIVLLNNFVKKERWSYKPSIPIYRLEGKTLGLAGFGRIPREVARKAKAFGLEVIAYDPYFTGDAKALGVSLVSLEELVKRADFLSLHTPLTKETHHLIGEKELARMKPTAFLINTSRGPVLDEKALIKALEEKQIAGAALDVFEKEPIERENPLLKMENVIINPHAAWYSEEAEVEMQIKAAQGVAEVLQGFFPRNLVNQEVRKVLNLKELP